jgi:disease resistance protein RPM1
MLRLSGTKLLTILTRLAELVGFVGPKNHVLDLISNSASSQVVKVIWIVGAGGLGKTTLAKKVYESSQVSDKFTCRAWVTVSQAFSVMELMKEMIYQLLGLESLNMVLDQRKELILIESCLVDHLKNGLKDKRYFLVLDDLWTVEAWDCIKPTFWGNNDHGSRVLVTTRNGDLAVQSSPSLTYKLNTLEKEDATSLLLRKTCRSLDDIRKDKMEETFDKIIKKCGGLPLAIVTIGSLLATTNLSE